jgi:flavin reductase (DIM6/NTAB) family NADH-FMN oxidoreductase RutF
MNNIKVNYEKMYYGFPVILISYYDKNGNPNITTLSSSYTLKDMMVLGFSSKGFAVNQIKEVKDFVVNVADSKLIHELEQCGKVSGKDCNKFEMTDLTPVSSTVVNAPIIAECPVSIECTLTQIVECESFQGITNIIAQIKGRLVSEDYLDSENRININKFDNIIYYGDGINKGFKKFDK